jgi:hypothetical protein
MMTPLEGTSWYYLKRTLDPRARIEYAIARESMEDGSLQSHIDDALAFLFPAQERGVS